MLRIAANNKNNKKQKCNNNYFSILLFMKSLILKSWCGFLIVDIVCMHTLICKERNMKMK